MELNISAQTFDVLDRAIQKYNKRKRNARTTDEVLRKVLEAYLDEG